MNAPEARAVAGPYVLNQRDDRGVVTLTLNRPQQFNALSEEMMAALQTELDALARDDGVRVVVLAARGKAFCPGHDLKQMKSNPSLRLLPPGVRAVFEADAVAATTATAGDRTRAWHRDSGRLPAGRDL